MKIGITAGRIFKALAIVNHVKTRGRALPILGHVLMGIENDKLVLSRTNLRVSIITKTSLPDQTGIDRRLGGDVVAPADSLMQLFGRLPYDDMVQIESSAVEITIKSAYGEYQFATMPVDEFPRIRNHARNKEIALKTDEFIASAKRSLICVSDDVARPALGGVLLRNRDNLLIAATDTHKLSWNEIEEPLNASVSEYIIPVDTLISVTRIAEASGELFIAFADKHVTFRADDTEVTSSLIEGPYPDVEQVIPNNAERVVILDKQRFIDAIERLAITSDDMYHRLELVIESKTLMMSTQHAHSGKRATESLDCELTGEILKIDFNLVYLSEILKHIETEEIRIELSNPNAPALFKPMDSSNYFYLIMPLR